MKTRRISAELHGEQAVMVDALIASLQFDGAKKENDSLLVAVALDVLDKTIQKCAKETGKRFPTIDDLNRFLEKD
jgi:hypothetical protein